jgi:hypothetical protein
MSPLADMALRDERGGPHEGTGEIGEVREQEEQTEQKKKKFASNSSLSASNHWPR